jgi:hypothetical protein
MSTRPKRFRSERQECCTKRRGERLRSNSVEGIWRAGGMTHEKTWIFGKNRLQCHFYST